MILGNGEWITVKDLPRWEVPEEESDRSGAHGHDLRRTVRAFEKSHIENVLKETDGDRTQTAELLGLSRSSLYRKTRSFRDSTLKSCRHLPSSHSRKREWLDIFLSPYMLHGFRP